MRRIITILLVVAMTVLCPISGFATEKEGLNLEGYEIPPMFDSSEWYDQTTGKVAYPITIDCPEWKTFDTHNEMLEACTIPEDLLKKLSTRELAELVLDYPLLTDFRYFSDMNQGMDIQIKNFNGLRELLNTADGLEVLMNLYEDIELEKVDIPENLLKATGSSFNRELEQLRAQDPQVYAEMGQGFKYDSQCQFIEMILEKFRESISGAQQKDFDISKSKKAANRISGYSYEQGASTKASFVLKTPSGKVVPTSYYLYDRAEMSATEKTAL